MKRFHILASGLVLLAVAPLSGCIIIANVGRWDGGCSRVWVEGPEQRIALEVEGLNGVDITTHNGGVTFVGSSEEAYVVFRPRAGAWSRDEAHRALEALEVYTERREHGVEHLGWRWREPKGRSWAASVSFEVHAPQACNIRAQTHNGGVKIVGAAGDVNVETHNGGINIQSTGEQLVAQTHNGGITARFGGRRFSLETHNGGIAADLSECTAIDGRIATHNGGINVTVGSGSSATVRASTHNGGITCRVPLAESEIRPRQLRGRLGDGDGSLTIATHNGGVRIEGREG